MSDEEQTNPIDEAQSDADETFSELESDADELEHRIEANEDMDDDIDVPDENDALGMGEEGGVV
jgi:hypothetical protein